MNTALETRPSARGADGTTSTASDRFAVTLARTVVRFRWLVITASLMLVVAAASGGRFLEFSNNYRVFFSQENPELRAFENFQATYTKNDNILFVVKPRDGQVFSPAVADAVERITAEAWKIPFAIRVDSITNFQHTWANGDELTVEDLIRDGKNLSPGELAKRRAIALAEPLLRGNLLDANADTTGINVTLQYPEKSLNEVPEAVAKARAIVAAVQPLVPDATIVLTGVSMLNNAFAEAGIRDVGTLIPVMYGILILFMVMAFRSLAATMATLLVIGFSTAAAMGLAGYLGIKLTPISVTAPTIILTLAIADSVHIMVSFRAALRDGFSKIEALIEAIRINFLAVTITSVTTIVGFLSLNFSDSPPFWHLGNITAMGIGWAWLFSLAFLPAVLSLMPLKTAPADVAPTWGMRVMDGLAEFVIRRYKAILLAGGAIAIALIAMVPRVELNDEFVKYFDHRIPFRGDAEFGMQHLTGIYLLEYSLKGKNAGGISEPEYLTRLAAFTEWMRAQPEVEHVYSYTDIIKRLNKNMNADDDAFYRLPGERDLAAQYLLLYELSLPYGLDLNDRINIDKAATRVTVTIQELSTIATREFLKRAETWMAANLPRYMHTPATGAMVMFSYISQRNIESMLRGNVIAVVVTMASPTVAKA